ncbi:MAG: endonuclease/exonuclease/phosphatase family protein [Pirellulales bacterium]
MRLLTYNIHKGIGGRDRRYRLERVIEVIATERPDVVCLQEVDRHVRRSRFDDQPHLLAEGLGLSHLTYQPTHLLKQGCYGNLILSRWPLFEHHHISLRLKRKKQRGAQLRADQCA